MKVIVIYFSVQSEDILWLGQENAASEKVIAHSGKAMLPAQSPNTLTVAYLVKYTPHKKMFQI